MALVDVVENYCNNLEAVLGNSVDSDRQAFKSPSRVDYRQFLLILHYAH